MVSEPTPRYHNCSANQLLIFGGNANVRELYILELYYLGHCHSRPYSYKGDFLLVEGSNILYRPEWYHKQNIVIYPCPIDIIKK